MHSTKTRMPGRDVIVIGASAGGVEALLAVVRGLPHDLAAAVLIVLHVPASSPSALPAILRRATKLRVVQGQNDMPLEHGTVIIAAPDHHLTLHGERVRLGRGPRVNGHRPAVDTLFWTAARALGGRVIGVVLSGALDDGTAGMVAIKAAGGATLVQSPSDAVCASMPASVLEQIEVDHVLPAADLPRAIAALVGTAARPARVRGPASAPSPVEAAMSAPDEDLELELVPPNDPRGASSGLTCPDCHGALWEISEGPGRFRCRVGHAYTAKGLFSAQCDDLEEAMWIAYRALHEAASLSRRLAERARAQKLPRLAERYELRETDALQRADMIRGALSRGSLDADGDARPEDDRFEDA